MAMTKVVRAVVGGLFDLLSPRLVGLTVVCLVASLVATGALAWLLIHFLVPLLPTGGSMGWLWAALHWLAGAGIVICMIPLAPPVSMFVGGLLFDVAARRVEEAIGAEKGRDPSIAAGIGLALRIAIPALVLNLLALPLALVPGVNAVVFVLLNGYLMGREHYLLASVRHVSWPEARARHRDATWSAWSIGMVGSLIPFVAPLYGASAMTRLVAERPRATPS